MLNELRMEFENQGYFTILYQGLKNLTVYHADDFNYKLCEIYEDESGNILIVVFDDNVYNRHVESDSVYDVHKLVSDILAFDGVNL